MSSEVPDGWLACKLGEIAVLGGGTTPSRAEEAYWINATTPWATPSDITSLSVGVTSIAETESQVSDRAMVECSLPLNLPGTVLMTSRATIGFAAINAVPMATNQGFITFKAGRNLDPTFLLHWLTASRTDLVAAAGGSTFKELSRGTAKLLPLLLPPLDEQRRIAGVLRSVDEVIICTQAVLSFCEDFLIAQRRETFLHLIEEPGENSTTFNEMCDLGRGFAFKSEDYQDSGVLNFRVTNVGKPIDDLGSQCFLPESFMETFQEYVLRGDEIVLVMVGATVGKLGRVPEGVCPALLNQNMWTLNAKPPFSHDLLWHLAHVLIEAKVHGAQGGAYSFLTKKDFLQHRVGRFDHGAMAARVSHLSSIEEYIQRLAEELRATIALKATMAADLLSGHVRVPT